MGYSDDSQPKPTESFEQESDVDIHLYRTTLLGMWRMDRRDAEVDADGREKRLLLEPKGREVTPVHWARAEGKIKG